jgi:hypothetical protein
LDALLLLHTETACRRGGALALRPPDLCDQMHAAIRGRNTIGRRRTSSSPPGTQGGT